MKCSAQRPLCRFYGREMKVVSVIFSLLGLCALVWAEDDDTQKHHYKVADKELLEKQRKILSLYKHINQPSHDPEHEQYVNTFSMEAHREQFVNYEDLKMREYYTMKANLLPKGHIFSISYPEHLEQAIAAFDALYAAKDFDTFYQLACKFRHDLNEGIFLYAFSVAVIHRADCYGIVIPPIYEVYPHYFFDSETIQEAYKYKQMWHGHSQGVTAQDSKYPGFTVLSNYSGHYLNLHPEQSLSYYLEDVGINSFYHTYYLYYPFWMDGKMCGLEHDKRGELYYFIHQQLFARYHLERLSNGWGQIDTVDFTEPVETPYYPSLIYPNGLSFPERPKFAKLSDYFFHYGQQVRSRFAYSLTFYNDISRRVADAIDRGVAYNKHGERVELYNEKFGYDIVGNLLQSNPDSPDNNFYGPWLGYGRHLLGYGFLPTDAYKVVPSALEHLETSLRDPGFYQLYKHLMNFYLRYQSRLKPYTVKELHFPGVQISKIEMDRLVTYFDDFYSDLSQAVIYSEDELKEENNQFFVRAKQYRLNHKPFTYKIHVKSDKDVKGVVKVFIGPKYDEYGRHINISRNRANFFELDKFIYDLKTGDNVIKRSSYQSILFAPDRTSYHDLYKKVMGALDGKMEFTIDGRENYFNFPDRYMLPIGSYGGHPFQFYFIIYPYKPYTGNKPQEWTYHYPRPGMGGPYRDDAPLLFPFDRPIKYEPLFETMIPNSKFYDVKIYHEKDINAIHVD